MSNAEQTDIARFCSAFLGGPDGHGDDRLAGLYTSVWTIARNGTKRTRWSRADDSDSIASAISALARSQHPDPAPTAPAHVFISTALVTEETAQSKGEHRRTANADAIGITALCVDIDINGPGHKARTYPDSIEEALSIVAAVELPPTLVVHSGGGIHVWWMLTEPWLTRDELLPEADARQAMAHLAHAWSATLRYHAQRLGRWKIDSTFDLARVMRVPGTWNVKPEMDAPTLARILEHDPNNTYEPDDFRERLADPQVLRTYQDSTAGYTGVLPKELADDEGNPIDLARVWARCNSTAYRAAGYTPEWMRTLLELMPGSRLEGTWASDPTQMEDESGSGLDASLVRQLHDLDVDTECIVEAVMCRRLRTGDKVEKVDPSRRTDYLVRTVVNIVGKAKAAAQERGAGGEPLAKKVTPLTVEQLRRAHRERQRQPEPAPEEPAASGQHDERADEEAFVDGALAAIADTGEEEAEPPAPAEPARTRPRPVADPDVQDSPRPALTVPAPRTPGGKDIPDPWAPRGDKLVDVMNALGELLLTEDDRKAGVQVWHLEYRDHGEAQKGRVVLSVPDGYQWPGSPPPIYRVGLPLTCDWYKRDSFEVPKGFRQSLIRDALMSAQPIGANRDAWSALIDYLPPFWIRDTSGSDMTAQAHEWLLEFLCGHPATLTEQEAADNSRAWLQHHADWGTTGDPRLLVHLPTFFDYVARQAGGPTGRNAKVLLNYLHLSGDKRPRLTNRAGRTTRTTGWHEVQGDQFNVEEWARVLTAAQDAAEAAERRHLRMVPGTGGGA